MNAKISVFLICVEAIIYLLLNNLHDCTFKLNHPFRKVNTGLNGLTYIGPAIWNRIPEILKKIKNLNTFSHKMRDYLNDLSNPNL